MDTETYRRMTLVVLQSHIYTLRDAAQCKRAEADEAMSAAKLLVSAAEYAEDKVRAVALYLNEYVGEETGTDYLAEVGLEPVEARHDAAD